MYKSLVFSMLVLFISAPAAVVGDVYKWVDKNGVVQFSDRPAHQGAEKVEVKNAISPSSVSSERRDKQQKVTSALEQERNIKEQQKERLKKQKEERAKNCNILKQRLQTYTDSQYMVEKDDKGEERILSDEEREKAIADTEKEIKQWCGK